MKSPLSGAPQRAVKAALTLVLASACWSLTGCQTIDITQPALSGVLSGRVTTPTAAGEPVVVVAIDRASGKVAHRAFLEAQRQYALPVRSGTYKLFAFEDLDGDGALDRDEPASVLYSIATPVNANDKVEMPPLRIRAARTLARR